MLALMKWLVLRLAAVRWILKAFGGLAFLLPVAILLKIVGLPILGVLSVLALPVFFMLFIFGLPIFLVLIAGGVVMAMLFAVLTIGIVVVKVGLFIVLPAWLIWKLASWMFRAVRRGFSPRDGGGTSGGAGTPDVDPA